MPFPGWSALTVHVPPATKETVEPEIVHTPALAGAMLKATARPELAVAETLYAGPPTMAAPGAVDVKLTVCATFATAKDCWT